MKRIVLIGLSLMFAVLFPLTFINPSDFANGNTSHATTISSSIQFDYSSLIDRRVISTATINDNFSPYTVGVVLTRQVSRNLRTYTVEDFPELRLSEVRHVGTHAEENIRQQLLEMRANSVVTRNTSFDVGIDSFRQMLDLTLQEPSKENVLRTVRLLERRSDVHAATPNFYSYLPRVYEEFENACIENQTLNNSQTSNWALDRISAPSAWGITRGSPNVAVGVIDSGIQGNHPRLRGVIHPNQSLHMDFVGNNALHDAHGHGTHVAGIISSDSSATGVAWNVRLVSLRVSNIDSGFNWATVRDAIDHATTNVEHIPILNLSLGGYNRHDGVEQSIRNFISAGGLVVAGSGNDNWNNDSSDYTFYPSSFSHPRYNMNGGVISVGATDNRDIRSPFSNWGATTVDLFAPGSSIPSTFPEHRCAQGNFGFPFGSLRRCEHMPGVNGATAFLQGSISSHSSNGLHNMSGTSMAAPHVSGVAALIISRRPDLTPNQIRDAIMRGTDRVAHFGLSVSSGILNAYQAIREAESVWRQPLFNSHTNSHGTVSSSNEELWGSGSPVNHTFNDDLSSERQSLFGAPAYHAFDGDPSTAWWDFWSSSPWLELRLDYFIRIQSIEILGTTSSGATSSFVGTNNVSLGSSFTMTSNSNPEWRTIQVGNVTTNTIRLRNTGIVAVHSIQINALVPPQNPQPIFREVAFLLDNNYIHSRQTVVNGGHAIEPPYVTKEGYAFVGWSVDGFNVIDLQNHRIFQTTVFFAVFSAGGWESVWTGMQTFVPIQPSVNLETLLGRTLAGKHIRFTTVPSGILTVTSVPFGEVVGDLTITIDSNFNFTVTAGQFFALIIVEIEIRSP